MRPEALAASIGVHRDKAGPRSPPHRRRLLLPSWLSVLLENQNVGRRAQPTPPRWPGLGPLNLDPTGSGARWAPLLATLITAVLVLSLAGRPVASWASEHASGGHSSPCLAPSRGTARSCRWPRCRERKGFCSWSWEPPTQVPGAAVSQKPAAPSDHPTQGLPSCPERAWEARSPTPSSRGK